MNGKTNGPAQGLDFTLLAFVVKQIFLKFGNVYVVKKIDFST